MYAARPRRPGQSDGRRGELGRGASFLSSLARPSKRLWRNISRQDRLPLPTTQAAGTRPASLPCHANAKERIRTNYTPPSLRRVELSSARSLLTHTAFSGDWSMWGASSALYSDGRPRRLHSAALAAATAFASSMSAMAAPTSGRAMSPTSEQRTYPCRRAGDGPWSRPEPPFSWRLPSRYRGLVLAR